MIRERVRPQWTPEQLAEIYAGPHDHRVLSPGHDARVTTTAWVGKFLYWPEAPRSICDLSTGNGVIPNLVAAGRPGINIILGDFAKGFQFTGPIEQTIEELRDPVDLFVCAETLEHLWDPDAVLRQIRSRADKLVASVPLVDDPAEEMNGEHYWAWDREGFEATLADAGWTPTRLFAEVPGAPGSCYPTYRVGIWGCE